MTEEVTLYLAVQTRLHRDVDGNVRSDQGYAGYEAWKAYLSGVAKLILIARVSDRVSDTGLVVEGPGVSVLAIPFYQGPIGFARQYRNIRRLLARELTDSSALYGARIGDLAGTLVYRRSARLGARFMAQVVGDPEDVLRNGAGGWVGAALAGQARRAAMRQVARADAVMYVTRRTLQAKYPSRPGARTLVRSNVELSAASFVDDSRDYQRSPIKAPLRLIAAGGQEQLYKGHGTLIEAVSVLRSRGTAVQATIIGDGHYHDSLVDLARTLKVSDSVEFLGNLPGAHLVQEHIRRSDIFVMPSLTEGLPRVLIEAMAGGVLSIGSRVGGIPELISDEVLFEPGNSGELADLVDRIVADPTHMTALARAQWAEAKLIRESYSGSAVLGSFLLGIAADRRQGERT